MTACKFIKILTSFLAETVLLSCISAYGQEYGTVATYNCPEANQGVAADGKYFYGIGNHTIVKCNEKGETLAKFDEEDPQLIKHFDGGIIVKGRLYCSHSNYPEVPMASSIEVFNPKDLSHVETISLGIDNGSCTWVVRGRNCWYVGFAHYDKGGAEPMKDNSWTQIVQYDNKWRRVQGWILPKELVTELKPHSISGALYVDGKLFCTGHTVRKLYILEFPPYGMRMRWTGTVDIPFGGQGIAMDPHGNLWGIDRKSKTVLKCTLNNQAN